MKAFTQASIAVALLAASASAQYRIAPDSVDESTRAFWCQQQEAQCPLICLQTEGNTAETNSNDCNPEDLTFSCVCSNGISPNVSEYSQTLPFFICQEWGNQCVSNCGNGNTVCQTACRDDNPCGAQNPTRVNTTTTTSSTTTSARLADASTSTASDGGVVTTDEGTGEVATLYGVDDESSAISHVRVWALSAGQTFGSMALVGGLIGGFAFAL